MKLVLKILNGAITAVLILVIAGAGGLAFSARLSGDAIPTVMGHKVLTVISGSMEPAIHTGDVIIVRPLKDPKNQVQEGDIITFRSQDKADMLITHRVMGTVHVNGEPAAFVTQGDANQSQDLATVTPERILGAYRWRIPYFGYVTDFARKPLGVMLLVILPGVVIIGLEIRKMWLAAMEEEKAQEAPAAPEGGDSQG